MQRKRKKSRGPQIGVFWLIGRRIVAFTEPVRRVRAVGGFKDSKLSHHHLWKAVARRRPTLSGREYWERPRSRVLYSVADDHFRVFLPRGHASNNRLVKSIVTRFSLPPAKMKVCFDEHYEPPSDLLDED